MLSPLKSLPFLCFWEGSSIPAGLEWLQCTIFNPEMEASEVRGRLQSSVINPDMEASEVMDGLQSSLQSSTSKITVFNEKPQTQCSNLEEGQEHQCHLGPRSLLH